MRLGGPCTSGAATSEMKRRMCFVFARHGNVARHVLRPSRSFGALMAGRVIAFAVPIWAERAAGLP